MDLQQISHIAEELARRFNPSGLVPFPYENIEADYPNLEIIFSDDLEADVSGAILHQNGRFIILISSAKPSVRQHFSTAHELGHFFLHQTAIMAQKGIVDDEGQMILFQREDTSNELLEREANKFATSLIMPEKLVREVWGVSKGVEDAAQLFHVPLVIISIRLEQMGLVL